MGVTQYYAAATLDGYIADPEDGLDWLMGYEGSYEGDDAHPGPMGEGGAYEQFYEQVGALVSGSATYEFVLEHGGTWPYAGKPYWVLSSRELGLPEGDGVDVRVTRAAVEEIHREMSAAAGDK